MTEEPEAPPSPLDRVREAVLRGDRAGARRLLKRMEQDPAAGPAGETAMARYLVATLHDDAGVPLAAAKAGVEAFPEHAELRLALGRALLDGGQAEVALIHLEEAVFLDPDFGDSWFELALAREAAGDLAGMKTAFAEVWDIDFSPPLPPLRFGRDKVEAWAERAILLLPPDVREAMRHLVIFVEDHPERWIVEDGPYDPRLVGLFDGPTYEEIRSGRASGLQPHIYLFQRNLESIAADSRDMAEQVRITVHHEVGHYLGLDEEELQARGLG